MKVTVLIENSAPEGLIREHGLSFLIEYRGGRYLLDAGESGVFLLNARDLGADLASVDAAFLSHGHYDHGDGFSAFFRVNRAARVYARPAVAEDDVLDGSSVRLDPGLFRRHGRRFDLADGPREPFPGIHLLPDAVPTSSLWCWRRRRAWWYSIPAATQGWTPFSPTCARAFRPPVPGGTGGLPPDGPGGTATLGPAPEAVRALARRLRDELDVREVFTGHCTGAPACALLAEELGERLHPLTTGAVFTFPD